MPPTHLPRSWRRSTKRSTMALSGIVGADLDDVLQHAAELLDVVETN